MTTTVKTMLWTRPNKDGEFFIKVRVTRHRKSIYISTGYAIVQSHWNRNRRSVRATHPQAKVINAAIEEIIAKAKAIERDLDREDEVVTASRVKQEVTGPEAESFLAYAREHITGC